MFVESDQLNRVPNGAASARELICASGALLLDWDGCVVLDGIIDPAAARLMAKFDSRTAIVSNNSTSHPAEFVASLRKSGVFIDDSRVILAGVEAIARAVEVGARRVMLIGNEAMKEIARSRGLEVVRQNVDTVLLLRDIDFSYAKLERAADALRQGARLILSNPDQTHPGRNRRLVPETGALFAALSACIDTTLVDIEVVGKPRARLFQRACDILNVQANRAVMIGDSPATDIAGAEAFGMRSILIGERSGFGFEALLN